MTRRYLIPEFNWKQWFICFLWRGHDDILTHQRSVTDYYSCLRCGRQRLKIYIDVNPWS